MELRSETNYTKGTEKQARHFMCNITLWHIRMAIVAMETKQCVLYVLSNISLSAI
jgi:hypothetical protein